MNKYFLIAIGVLLLALAGSGLYIKSLRSDLSLSEANETAAMAAFEQCEKDKETSYEVSENYQKRLSDLNGRIADLRMRDANASCVVVEKSERGSDATATGDVNADVLGIGYQWGIGFAGECERYRLQVLGLQEFNNLSKEP